MQHTQILKAGCLVLAALLGAALVLPVVAAGPEQELRTLKLVNAYQSEAEFQAANAKILRAKRPIVDEGGYIKFLDPDTGNVLKQIKNEKNLETILHLTAEEQAKLTGQPDKKGILKTYIGYYFPHRHAPFLLETETEVLLTLNQEGERREKQLRASVYNARGDKLVDLPQDVNVIAGDSSGQAFVAYYDDALVNGEILYFYDANGRLLKTQTLQYMFPVLAYSQGGMYVTLWSQLGNVFYIFSNKGDLILKGDSLDYAQNTKVEGVFISDDGNYILLSTTRQIFLLDHTGKKLWDVVLPPPFRVYSTYFDLQRGQIYISSLMADTLYDASRGRQHVLKIMNVRDGQLLHEISNIVYYTITHDKLSIKFREGNYNEYAIQE